MQAQTPAAESGFQRRSWAVQRVGWLVLAAWLLASATGVIGPGLSVQYDRVLHLDASTRVVVFLDCERAGALSRQPLRDAMQRARVGEADVLAATRTHRGLEQMNQIRLAVLERTGAISLIPERGAGL